MGFQAIGRVRRAVDGLQELRASSINFFAPTTKFRLEAALSVLAVVGRSSMSLPIVACHHQSTSPSTSRQYHNSKATTKALSVYCHSHGNKIISAQILFIHEYLHLNRNNARARHPSFYLHTPAARPTKTICVTDYYGICRN